MPAPTLPQPINPEETPDTMLPVSACAQKVGLAECTIREWIRTGHIPAEVVGKRYMVRVQALLDAISRPTRGDTDMMTVLEASNLLGVTEQTVRRMASRGEIPAHRVGARWRFLRQDLVSFTQVQ